MAHRNLFIDTAALPGEEDFLQVNPTTGQVTGGTPAGGGAPVDSGVGYVDANGNDTTGDGTFSNPYLTIQKAIDVGKHHIRLGVGTFAAPALVQASGHIPDGLSFTGMGIGVTIIGTSPSDCVSANMNAATSVTVTFTNLTLNGLVRPDGDSSATLTLGLMNVIMPPGSSLGCGGWSSSGTLAFIVFGSAQILSAIQCAGSNSSSRVHGRGVYIKAGITVGNGGINLSGGYFSGVAGDGGVCYLYNGVYAQSNVSTKGGDVESGDTGNGGNAGNIYIENGAYLQGALTMTGGVGRGEIFQGGNGGILNMAPGSRVTSVDVTFGSGQDSAVDGGYGAVYGYQAQIVSSLTPISQLHSTSRMMVVNGAAYLNWLMPQDFMLALSDTSSALVVGVVGVQLVVPFGMTLAQFRATVNTAPTGANLIVSVSRNASFLFDATIVDGEILYEDSNVWVTLSKEDILTFEITQVGSGEAGKGLVVTLSGKRLVA